MYWLNILVVLLLLDNIENSKLFQEKLQSRLAQKESSELQVSSSNTRQLHRCYRGCSFQRSFNESLVIDETCNEIESDRPCEMIVFVDHEGENILFLLLSNAANLIFDNITYDSSVEHLAHLELSDNGTEHIIDYACSTGDFCEWEYAQEVLPKVIQLDYRPLLNLLAPKLVNSGGHPDVTECYVDNMELANCSSGSCQFFQSVDGNYEVLIVHRCIGFANSFLEVGTVRHTPGPAKHDYNILSYTCDYDKCNNQSIENEVRQILCSNANEYTNIDPNPSECSNGYSSTTEYTTTTSSTTEDTTTTSSTTEYTTSSLGAKHSLINFYWYFSVLFLIKYFK